MKNIGVIANTKRPHAEPVLSEIACKARRLGFNVHADPDTAALLKCAEPLAPENFAEKIDVALALGGDGTVLFTAKALAGADIPIFGLNLGSLGFLTSVGDQEIDHALEALASGNLRESVRSVADCSISANGKPLGEYRALNDMVIAWGRSSHITTVALRINGEEVSQFMCDGVIISTPTGSTGHSLSAGGPILHPETPVFVINVICPHTLSSRPMVIPDSSEIEIEVLKARKTLVCSVDGQDIYDEVGPGFTMKITKSEKPVRFLQLPDHSYFDVLTKKLHWRGSSL
ncbi:NAD(+)/NADH kinase [Verrucomicrobiota bacterium]